jgi:hypothetical protein
VFQKQIARGLGVALFAVLVIFAGCGGSDEGSDSTNASAATVDVEASSLTKAQFVAKANAICGKGTSRMAKIVQKAIVGEGGIEPVEKAAVPMVNRFVSEIQALGAPEGEEERVAALLTAFDEEAKEVETTPSKSMEEFAARFKKSGDLARSYGLTACALG